MPIGLCNKVESLENVDILMPNRLRLGRNNNRFHIGHLVFRDDHKRVLEANARIFETWFRSWLISYVPKLVDKRW